MEAIIIGLLVNGVTWGSKKIMPFVKNLPTWGLRGGIAVVTYIAVLLSSGLNGTEIDPIAAETLVNTLYSIGISQGAFFWAHKKND